ncbi:MAG: pyridoxamine 5'-phosphate oxidase family protein [Proteobacteria bacterium]|nr:pyridoxamine 5'-phosphate oxidase family protein [Pseudomonadota bacterium]
MNWKEYFETKKGKGFLATAGKKGEVNIAVYSRPHVMDDNTLAFGMTERLTHANLQENPYAVYAFNATGFEGFRLYLEKVREETEGPLLDEIRKRADEVVYPGTGDLVKYVVYFRVIKDLPLVVT